MLATGCSGDGVWEETRVTGDGSYPRIARAICSSGLKPRRTIVFASWTGEEGGLVGSDYFAVRKKVPTSLIYSAGEHPNYHTTRDVPAAINRQVLGSAAKLALLTIWRAAND